MDMLFNNWYCLYTTNIFKHCIHFVHNSVSLSGIEEMKYRDHLIFCYPTIYLLVYLLTCKVYYSHKYIAYLYYKIKDIFKLNTFKAIHISITYLPIFVHCTTVFEIKL